MATEEIEFYRVMFARQLTDIPREPGTIGVAPDPGGRSAGGFVLSAEFVIYPRFDFDQGAHARVDGYLGFAGNTKSKGDVRELIDALDRAGTDLLPAEKLPPFFTMLPDLQGYRELVGRLGPDEIGKVLRALHDMVLVEDRHLGGTWVREAKESDIFNLGFLRSSESYFVWKNAGSILQGEEAERIGLLSDTLKIRFKMEGRPNPYDLEFSFSLHEPVLPKRFAVVIGKNGVGKSQMLGRIAQAALTGSAELTDGQGGRPQINRLLAFYPTPGAASIFPRARRGGRIWYRRFSLSHAGNLRGRQTTSDVIVHLARTNKSIAQTERMEIFLVALQVLDGYQNIALRYRSGRPGYFRIYDVWEGDDDDRSERFAWIDLTEEPVRVVGDRAFPLSSGELAFVRFAALASLFIENSSLLLFDEPETHLHPNFIGQFVALLDSVLKQTGSAAIIATHSAYFVRETFDDQVRVLRTDEEGRIEVITPRLRTFGADVGSISHFVFGEGDTSRLAMEVETQIAGSGRTWESIFEQYRDELSLDLLSEIRARVEGRR